MALPTLSVRIAWESDPFDDEPIWSDVTADIIAFNFHRGRQHELDRFEAGIATIILKNFNGQYWSANDPNVDIRKKVSIRAIYDEITYDRYTGFIESMTPGWLSNRGGLIPIMKINCADAIAIFSRARLNDESGYSQETSGDRIENVLDDVGFPAADREIDEGKYTIMASGALQNVIAQEHIFKVAESEIGLFYMAANGNAIYESRSHRTEAPHTVSQATFNDTFADIELALDDKLLFNEIRATRQGGEEQVATDSTSAGEYGRSTLLRSELLLTSNATTRSYAYYLLARFGYPAMRAKSITFEPQSNPAVLFPLILSFDISTRITVQKAEGSIDADCFIEGIDEDYDVRLGRWRTQWQLSDAERYLFEPDEITDILRPIGAGDKTQLTPVGEANNWQCVDEEIANDDADYVWSNGGDGESKIDFYAIENPPYESGVINYITLNIRARSRDGDYPYSDNDIFFAIKTHDTEYTYPVTGSGNYPTIYTDYSKQMTTNPFTGNAWTWQEVIDLQAGEDLRGTIFGLADDYYCTQVYVEVNYTPAW